MLKVNLIKGLGSAFRKPDWMENRSLAAFVNSNLNHKTKQITDSAIAASDYFAGLKSRAHLCSSDLFQVKLDCIQPIDSKTNTECSLSLPHLLPFNIAVCLNCTG